VKKIVIEISEDYYELIKDDVEHGMDYLPCVLIANGTPLEEHCESCIYMPTESEDQ
jgi:hypothetical protein